MNMINGGLVEFAIIGTIITLALWIAQLHTLRVLTRLALQVPLLLVFLLIAGLFSAPLTLGEEHQWYNKSPFKELLFFFFMLLGMSARYITKAIEKRREIIEEMRKSGTNFKKPSIEFDAWEFAYPFFISAITFGLLMSQLEKENVTISNIALSFQTGFFWQTILAAKQKA